MDSKAKKLSEIQKAVDEQLRGVDLDPMGSVVFGSDDEVSALPREPEEPFTPSELSREEKRQLDEQTAANDVCFRLFAEFADDELNEDYRMTPQFKAAIEELERAELEKFVGRGTKEKDPLDELVEQATDLFIKKGYAERAFALAKDRMRGGGTVAKGQWVRPGSERERAARSEVDNGWVSEFSASGALIRCYEA